MFIEDQRFSLENWDPRFSLEVIGFYKAENAHLGKSSVSIRYKPTISLNGRFLGRGAILEPQMLNKIFQNV